MLAADLTPAKELVLNCRESNRHKKWSLPIRNSFSKPGKRKKSSRINHSKQETCLSNPGERKKRYLTQLKNKFMETEPETILIVNDNRNDIELAISAFSEKLHFKRHSCCRRRFRALDFLYEPGKFSGYQNGNPSVILLNIIMPHMNGIEVLKHTFKQILNSG